MNRVEHPNVQKLYIAIFSNENDRYLECYGDDFKKFVEENINIIADQTGKYPFDFLIKKFHLLIEMDDADAIGNVNCINCKHTYSSLNCINCDHCIFCTD